MAERRMIHKKASVSVDLMDLREAHGADAALLYVLMIPHMDRWGCVPDSPAKIRAMVVPMFDVTVPQVKAWVGWMVKRGMLERVVGPAGDRGLRAVDFHEHQRGTEWQKEAQSPFEPAEVTAQWVRGQRAAKDDDLQGGRRPLADQSQTTSRVVGAKGMERKGSKTSLSIPSEVVESAGAEPEPDPFGAQSRPPVEVNGDEPVSDGRVDLAAIAAAAPPAIGAAIERARRKAVIA